MGTWLLCVGRPRATWKGIRGKLRRSATPTISASLPYWIQLDTATLAHFFSLDVKIEQSFPHGFITTKLFPASFCELGIERFRAELQSARVKQFEAPSMGVY